MMFPKPSSSLSLSLSSCLSSLPFGWYHSLGRSSHCSHEMAIETPDLLNTQKKVRVSSLDVPTRASLHLIGSA